MLYQKKYQRAMELLRKKNGTDREDTESVPDEDAERREIERKKRASQDIVEPEKHDILAMLISAFLTILPVAIVVLLVMCLPMLLVILLH